MKILVLADVESKALWDFFEPAKLEGIDLIISCGDLNPHYLSLLATFTSAPVYYVHGNHDVRYDTDGPDGCECIDDRIVIFRGIRIMGLGGSMRYKPGKYQYTEKQMRKRIHKLYFKILNCRGVDILVAHAPAYQLNDGQDLTHRGFECFRKFMEKYHPLYFVHGHIHACYCDGYKRESVYMDTKIINAFEKYVIEIPDDYKTTPPVFSSEGFRKWRWEHFRK